MEKQNAKEPKTVLFTEQRTFTLGDERFKIEKPLNERRYLKLKDGTTPKLRVPDFSMGSGREESQRCGELFLKYAHRLFEKRDQILSDSRLYNVRLPFATSFCSPTLGDYMVWWKHYKCSQVLDPEGNPQFIYSFWGGFSGVQGVAYLDCEGRSFFADVDDAGLVRASLNEVCTFAKDKRDSRDVLTIEQAIRVLFDEDM